MIDTLVDATEATCPASNRTITKFQKKNMAENLGLYTLFDKVNGETIVGLDPFRKSEPERSGSDTPKTIEKRSPIAEKEYFDPHLYLKFVQSSPTKSSSDFEAETMSNFSPLTRRLKDSDPKSYIPPKQSSKKIVDPKTSAQNDLSLRYQSTIPKYGQMQWYNPTSVGSIPIVHTSPVLRIFPSYNTWPFGVAQSKQPLLSRSTLPYLPYPLYSPSSLQAASMSIPNYCYPFCYFNDHYSING